MTRGDGNQNKLGRVKMGTRIDWNEKRWEREWIGTRGNRSQSKLG